MIGLTDMLEEGRERDADPLIRAGLAAGSFVRLGRHTSMFLPADGEAPPLCVKPHRLTGTERARLDLTFRWLRERGDPEYVPHWITGEFVISKYVGGTRDLAGHPGLDGEAVRRICTASLTRFMVLEARIRTRLEEKGLLALPAFPLGERWRWACAEFAVLTGVDVRGVLGDPPADASRTSLFFDPKPANYLAPAPPAPPVVVWRIDLDLLGCTAPVALQIAIMLFSHPIPGTGFRVRREHAHRVAAELGVERGETDLAICYHLLRNWVSASQAGDRGKADGLRPWLRECLHQATGIGWPQ